MSPQWLRLFSKHQFDYWPGEFPHAAGVAKKKKKKKKKKKRRSSVVAQQVKNLTLVSMKIQSLASLSGLGI